MENGTIFKRFIQRQFNRQNMVQSKIPSKVNKRLIKQIFIKKIKMNLSSTIVLFLLIGVSYSVTDISLLNCPSSYLKSTPTETQKGFVDFGKTLYAAYQTNSYKKTVYKIVIQGDMQQLSSHQTVLQIPFILVALTFLIIMIFVILWCIFSRSCPPWPWTKRDPFLNPYTHKQMRYTLFWLFLFAVAILIISVLILSQMPNLKNNLQQTKCSIFVTIDTVLNGNGASSGWDGIRQLRNNIGNISSLISSTTTQIGLYFTGDDWLQDDMKVMKIKNNFIYSQNKDAQLISPNHMTTATHLQAGFPAPLIDSLFIRKVLDALKQQDRMTNQIQKGFNVTQKLSDQAYLVDRSARLLDGSSATIKQNFVLAQNRLNMYIRQIEVYLEDFQLIDSKYFTSGFTTLLFVVQFVIAICLIGTMLVLIGAFSTSTFRILECRKMVHLGWLIYSCSFIGGLLLMYLFIGLGSISYGFCQYYTGIIDGTEVFNDIKEQNSQNILNQLDVCLYGNGNVLQSFGVDYEVKTLEQLFTNIQTYEDYTNISSPNYINTSFSIQTLNKWTDIIQNYKLGIFIDSDPNQSNQDNPNYSLDQLNSYSNSAGGAACPKDRWVFDKRNCTDFAEQTYNTTNKINGAAFTTDKTLCISFNEGFALVNGALTRWSQQDFIKRYFKIQVSCADVYTNIMKFANPLIDYRNSRIDLFQGIKDAIEQILSQNRDFNEMLVNFRSRVTQFSDSTKTIKNLVISQTKGIKYTVNCSSVGSKMKDTHTVFCRNFMSQIVRIGLLSIFLTVILLFGIWAGSLFAVRYSQIQKNQRLNMPESQADSQRIISDKKSDQSD